MMATLWHQIRDSDGYYDITVPYEEEYSDEEVQIQVEGDQADVFDYQFGEVEEIDLIVEASQQQEEQEEDSPSSGGPAGGSFTEDSDQEDQEVNETEDTQDSVSEINETSEEDEISSINETDTEDNQTENNQTSDETTNFITGLFASEPSAVGGFLSSMMDSISSFISNLF